jgi:hypothetical protein
MNHDRKEIIRVLTVPLACACLVGALLWPNWREEIYAQTYYCYDSSSSAAPASGGAAPMVVAATAVSTLSEPVDCEESPYLCVDGTSRYIAHVYADLLGRWPGPTEIVAVRVAYPTGLPDLQFAQEIVASPEYRHQVVQNLTQRLLGRPATSAELAFWSPQDHRAITLGLMTTQEYAERQGGTDTGVVKGVYQDLLGRAAEPEEISKASARRNRLGRLAVVQELYESEEHHGEQVDSVYIALLRMPPATAGRAAWVRELHMGGTIESIIEEIVASDEYADREEPGGPPRDEDKHIKQTQQTQYANCADYYKAEGTCKASPKCIGPGDGGVYHNKVCKWREMVCKYTDPKDGTNKEDKTTWCSCE